MDKLVSFVLGLLLAAFAAFHSWQMFNHFDFDKIMQELDKLNQSQSTSGSQSSPTTSYQSLGPKIKVEPTPAGLTFDAGLLTLAASLLLRAAAPSSPIWSQRCNLIAMFAIAVIALAIVLSFFGINQIMFG